MKRHTPSASVTKPSFAPDRLGARACGVLLITRGSFSLDGDEVQNVREREGESAGGGIHPKAEVGGDVDRNLSPSLVAGGGRLHFAVAEDRIDATGPEQVDTEDRAMPAVQREAVLAPDLGGELAVAYFDDLRAQKVRRR